MITVTYIAEDYAPELVTGRYVRCEGRKGNYWFKVLEAATCLKPGHFYGMAGMGYTLREYITRGDELPEEIKSICILSKQTERLVGEKLHISWEV